MELFHGDRLQGAKRLAKRLKLQQNCFHFKTVNEKQIIEAIKKSKPSKCSDVSGISPYMLKLAPEILAIPLTYIINKVILEGVIPKCWKVARVLPLHKKKSKSSVENYRPVSILPSPSKIMEEVLRKQMSKYLEEKGILPPSQFGFRAGRSTIQATGIAIHNWQTAKKEKLKCGALQFDLSAAFDMISPNLLLEKLRIYGAGSNVRKVIGSYLSDRQQRVDYDDTANVPVGSPQGSCLSPLLYITLVADLDEWISKGEITAYADDSSIYFASKSRDDVRNTLENAAKEMLSFFQASFLAANESKTKFVMFGRGREEEIRVGSTPICESEKEELLGFIYNKSLTWKDHLEHMEAELRKRIGVIRRLSWHLPTFVLTKMIEPIFSSKLRYGIEMIGNCLDENDTVLKKLHSLHRSAMKASLRMSNKDHPTDAVLLQQTGQKSVVAMAKIATANMAWKAGQNWDNYPLTAGRTLKHYGLKCTRQAAQRMMPPQKISPNLSLVSRLVEMWELLPENIKLEKAEHIAKRKIGQWILSPDQDQQSM